MIHFTVKAPLNSFETVLAGAVPGGYRLQVTYLDGITFEGHASDGREQLIGKVTAGSDWVLLRDDGAAVFDAKITFRAETPQHQFDAELRGRASLAPLGWGKPIREKWDWESLTATSPAKLQVALPIQFETANPKLQSADKALKKLAEQGRAFADLAQHQFVARGSFTVSRGRITEAELYVLPIEEFPDPILNLLYDRKEACTQEARDGLVPLLEKLKDKLIASYPQNRDHLAEAFAALAVELENPSTPCRTLDLVQRIRESKPLSPTAQNGQ